jgi:hypothetical protein
MLAMLLNYNLTYNNFSQSARLEDLSFRVQLPDKRQNAINEATWHRQGRGPVA